MNQAVAPEPGQLGQHCRHGGSLDGRDPVSGAGEQLEECDSGLPQARQIGDVLLPHVGCQTEVDPGAGPDVRELLI